MFPVPGLGGASRRLGGECLNYGCIPSKALIGTGNFVHKARKAEEFGVSIPDISVDMAKLQEWKEAIVERLTSGGATLCRGDGGEGWVGEGAFTGPDPRHVTHSA